MALSVALRTSLTKPLLAVFDAMVRLTGVATAAVCVAHALRSRKELTNETAANFFMRIPFGGAGGKPEEHAAYQGRRRPRRARLPSTPRERSASSSTSPA